MDTDSSDSSSSNDYSRLSDDDDDDEEKFECLRCIYPKEKSEIIELNCTHIFCWVCIHEYLEENTDIKVKCPEESCYEFLTDSEKRKVLSDDGIEIYEKKCLDSINNTHKCLLPQCGTVVVYTDPNTQYTCSVCTLYNCVSCKAPHTEYKCKGFQSLSAQIKTSYCQAEMDKAKKIYEERKMTIIRENALLIDLIEIVYNDRIFECQLCGFSIGKGDGVVLKNCCCHVCKSCLVKHVLSSSTIPVICPICYEEQINEEEIYSILSPEELVTYQNTSKNVAKSKLDSHFLCQAINCGALHHTKPTTTSFPCSKCKAVNCVPCKAVHMNENCEQYKLRMSNDKNQQFIEDQIRQGIIWPCIVCKTILRKISGCNWVQCPNCKIELCWIRKMRRWGPKGRDDISDGCKCMVDNIPCHENCTTTCWPHQG